MSLAVRLLLSLSVFVLLLGVACMVGVLLATISAGIWRRAPKDAAVQATERVDYRAKLAKLRLNHRRDGW